MITLKDYQNDVLKSLRMFFRQCAREGYPDAAFLAVQRYNAQDPVKYFPVTAAGFERAMPYICVRVPTGGGKTLLACHTAGLAMTDFLHAERAVVLWLTPSNTILDQTVAALRDPRHPYRRALELGCGAVEVMNIEEALRLSRATVDGHTVVIVATIQSFRVEDTTGRKVYEQNGAFTEHLLNVPADRLANLLPGADGKPKPSLVNMLRLRRPVVIVDEAHNARTDLSFATLGNVMPACIVEFTATPARTKHPSNVIHSVSAAQLKAADMVKLPLRVVTRHPSQRDRLLGDALALRADLERLAIAEAQATGEYLRPILLLQAERVDACEPLREQLVRDYPNISPDQVKISVGRLDELKDVADITAPSCPVRYIITVEKLREGWDCPFAYVLCSLKETRSATAIEQIVGRILRLPRAQAKRHPDLNCAYAFSVSESLPEVLNELRQALENNGFTRAEADRIVIPVSYDTLPLGRQPQSAYFDPETEIDAVTTSVQVVALEGKVQIDTSTGEITVLAPLDRDETKMLTSCVKTPEAKVRIAAVVDRVREIELAFGGAGQSRVYSPFERGVDFRVPMMCVMENGQLFEFESTYLLDPSWKLSAKDASLADDYNPLAPPIGQSGTLNVGARGQVVAEVQHGAYATDFIARLHQQVIALGGLDDWTLESLVAWLDRHIDHRDIPQAESATFLLKVVRGLLTRFADLDVARLAMDRFRLRDEIERRINEHRLAARREAFQNFLLPQSALTVSDEYVFDFKKMGYEPSWLYEGSFQFKRHYFPKPGELHELTPKGKLKEEFECAQFIDELDAVSHWVRNLSRKPSSFRLQTATDWFYPDFICQLNDGRLLVVEYKGDDIYTADDAAEKRAIGAVWESRSEGRCLFVMPTKGDFSSILKKIR